jgi:hypothetical protein
MKLTLKQRLLRYLQARPGVRVSSGELQRLTVEKTTYTAQNAGRRLRELAEDGIINVDYVRNHAYYTYQPPATRQVRRVVIEGGMAREVVETVAT